MKAYKWFFLIFVSGIMISCKGTSEEELIGDWQKRTGLPRGPRGFAATFVIGNKGYVISGHNGTNVLRREVFAFDHTVGEHTDKMGEWSQLNSLPTEVPARYQAVGFSVNGKGYMGTGWAYIDTDDDKVMRDFWQYDPDTDSWTEVAPLPADAEARRGAIAFSLFEGGKEYGYVGCGYTGDPDREYLKDFWRFDPDDVTDGMIGKWTPIRYRCEKRAGGAVFVIDNKAYICNGENPQKTNDFWVFDPNAIENEWEKRRQMANVNPDEDYDDDYGSLSRAFGVAYVVWVEERGQFRGHIVGGNTNGSSNWEYDHNPANEDGDLWVQRTSFYNNITKQSREGMISFSFPNSGRAFVGLGRQGGTYYDDLWEFIPLIDDYIYDDY